MLLLLLDSLEFVLVFLGLGLGILGRGDFSPFGLPLNLHVASLPTLIPCSKSKSIFPLRNPASFTALPHCHSPSQLLPSVCSHLCVALAKTLSSSGTMPVNTLSWKILADILFDKLAPQWMLHPPILYLGRDVDTKRTVLLDIWAVCHKGKTVQLYRWTPVSNSAGSWVFYHTHSSPATCHSRFGREREVNWKCVSYSIC